MADTYKQSKEEVQHNLVNNLYWKSCIRDDQAVVRSLYINREIDSIYGLEETGLLDDFFHFLQTRDIWSKVEKLNTPEIKRVMVSITQYVVLYMERSSMVSSTWTPWKSFFFPINRP